ncbi:MAG TPA: hypothetical protein VF070_23050 [Streptosporangiaceae bacterium]
MKGGAQTALAIGVGYILGRRRKMRLATVIAVGAATGGAARLGPVAMRQGAKMLGKADIAGALGPQVTEIVDTVRGDLLDAAKGAATAAVTNRIESLSDSLHDRAETLRNPEAAVGKVGETARDTVGETAGKAGKAGKAVGRVGRVRPRRGEEPDEAGEEPDEYDEPADEYEDEEDLDEAPVDEADEADELEEDETEAPAPRRRRATRSPVSRTRR